MKNKRTIIAAVMIMVSAAAVFAGFRLFWKEDARELYFKAERDNFNKISQWISDNYDSFKESQQPYKTVPYKRHLELTADMTSGGKPFGMENAGRLYDLVKKSKLVVDTRRQPAEDTGISDITLLVQRVPFIDMTAFTRAGKLCFTIPVLMPERYFSVDINSLDGVYDRFSLPVRPKRLVNTADIAQTIKFDKTSFDQSAKMLGEIFSENIGKDAVKYGDSKELTISGQTVRGREVLVSLDEAAAEKLAGGLFHAAVSDEALLAFTYGNFADLSALLDDAGLFRLSEYLDSTGTVVLNEKEKKFAAMLNVKKNLDSFRDMMRKAFEGHSVKNGLEMAVIIGSGGEILDRKLDFDLAAKDGSEPRKIMIHTGCSNTVYEDIRNRFITVTVTQGKITTEYSIIPEFDKTNDTDTRGKISISFTTEIGSGAKSGTDIKLDIAGSTDVQTLKRNDIVKFRMDMFNEEDKGSGGSVAGDLDRVSWKNKKLNTTSHTVKLAVKADLPTFGIKDLSAVVDLAGEDRLGIEPIVFPEIKQDKLTDLNTASDKDIDRLKLEAAASFGMFYLTNKPIFDAILGQD